MVKLPVFVPTVGLVMNPHDDEIAAINSDCNISYWQFHGAESAETCVKISQMSQKPYIKTVPLEGLSTEAVSTAFSTHQQAAAKLVDGHKVGEMGGSGKTANWKLLSECLTVAQKSKLILAGGLTPDNIIEALQNSDFAGWKISDYRERIEAPGMVNSVYRMNVSSGHLSQIIRISQTGKIVQIKME